MGGPDCVGLVVSAGFRGFAFGSLPGFLLGVLFGGESVVFGLVACYPRRCDPSVPNELCLDMEERFAHTHLC